MRLAWFLASAKIASPRSTSAGHDARVGGETRGEQERRLGALELGEPFLQLRVLRRPAADERAGAPPDAAGAAGLDGRGDEPLVGREAEIVVRREVDERPPPARRRRPAAPAAPAARAAVPRPAGGPVRRRSSRAGSWRGSSAVQHAHADEGMPPVGIALQAILTGEPPRTEFDRGRQTRKNAAQAAASAAAPPGRAPNRGTFSCPRASTSQPSSA